MSANKAFYDVRDIFGDREVLENPKKAASAASVTVKRDERITWAYSRHKEDKIDKIVKEYGQGNGYSKWQKERYKVNVKENIPKEVLRVKTFDRDLDLEEANLSGARYKKADFNYNRKRVMGC